MLTYGHGGSSASRNYPTNSIALKTQTTTRPEEFLLVGAAWIRKVTTRREEFLLVGQGSKIHHETRRISLGGGGLKSEYSPRDKKNFSLWGWARIITFTKRPEEFLLVGVGRIRKLTRRPEEFLLVGVGSNQNIHQETGRISLGGGSSNQ